jgi:hypothetical protein
MEITTNPPRSFSERCHTLEIAAQAVRQRAVRRGDDLIGWRLARLMRDACTDTQVNDAEHKYVAWRRACVAHWGLSWGDKAAGSP